MQVADSRAAIQGRAGSPRPLRVLKIGNWPKMGERCVPVNDPVSSIVRLCVPSVRSWIAPQGRAKAVPGLGATKKQGPRGPLRT